MKSIKQQYIDLQEGNMSQANFMRNLRMSLPQYVTNVTSFEDSVRILKNKGILTEADEKGKWTNTSGKSMYDQFNELNNLNGQEVLIGIDYEIEKNHELTKEEATKIVIKNLKKDPYYYTTTLMAGKEGYKSEYIGGKSAQPEARQMQPLDKNMGNVVDKKMGMQPVKNVEKAKKDSDKAIAQKYKTSGIDLMSLVAKTVRGVKKMDATGEKMKKVTVKENKVAKTIFDKNANITKGVTDIAKGEDKKKLTKEYLLQMIQEELKEMFDGMEPMDRTGLDENTAENIKSVDQALDNSKVQAASEKLAQDPSLLQKAIGELSKLGIDKNTLIKAAQAHNAGKSVDTIIDQSKIQQASSALNELENPEDMAKAGKKSGAKLGGIVGAIAGFGTAAIIGTAAFPAAIIAAIVVGALGAKIGAKSGERDTKTSPEYEAAKLIKQMGKEKALEYAKQKSEYDLIASKHSDYKGANNTNEAFFYQEVVKRIENQ